MLEKTDKKTPTIKIVKSELTDLTSFQLFLYTIILAEDKVHTDKFEYINLYPKIESEETEDSDEQICFNLDCNLYTRIYYELYDSDIKTIFKGYIYNNLWIKSVYAREFLVEMSEYLNLRNQATLKPEIIESLVSLRQLEKILYKTNFLLKCFSLEKMWLDMMFDP